jgi:hypothetical protein
LKWPEYARKAPEMFPFISTQTVRNVPPEVRLASGIAAENIGRGMGFTPKMVFYMERSEQVGTISLDRLGQMARAMECDLCMDWCQGTGRWRIGRWSWWNRRCGGSGMRGRGCGEAVTENSLDFLLFCNAVFAAAIVCPFPAKLRTILFAEKEHGTAS